MGYAIGALIGFALAYHPKVRGFVAKGLVVVLALVGVAVLVSGALA